MVNFLESTEEEYLSLQLEGFFSRKNPLLFPTLFYVLYSYILKTQLDVL
jgi:hypothetical protein